MVSVLGQVNEWRYYSGISFLGRHGKLHRTKPTQTLQFIINQEQRRQLSIRIAFMRGTSLNMLRCASALLLLFGLSHCAELLITNYGAVSDDNIDDYGAFVEAINAAQSGDTIRVPTGVYLISSTITLNKSGVKFLGKYRCLINIKIIVEIKLHF